MEKAREYIKRLERKLRRQQQQQIPNVVGAAAAAQQGQEPDPPHCACSCNKRMRLVKKQNRKLRELIRHEFAKGISESDFVHKTIKEIQEMFEAARLGSRQQQQHQPKPLGSVAGKDESLDVFVAPLPADDHTYSLVVQDQIDVEIETEENSDWVQGQQSNTAKFSVGGDDDDDEEEEEIENLVPG